MTYVAITDQVTLINEDPKPRFRGVYKPFLIDLEAYVVQEAA